MKPPKFDQEVYANIERMRFKERKTLKQIADFYGVSVQTIRVKIWRMNRQRQKEEEENSDFYNQDMMI